MGVACRSFTGESSREIYPKGSKKDRNGQRNTWISDMVAIEASAYLRGSSGDEWPFRIVAN